MKAALLFTVWIAACQSVLCDDITFTNRIVTFTNLEGQAYNRVQLVRADADGLIWRDGASGGRVCYTNLHPNVLESLEISSNRIAIARARAGRKAVADAQYRAEWYAEAQAKLQKRAERTNEAPSVVSWPASEQANLMYGPDVGYGPGFMYPPAYLYGPWWWPDLGPRAPSAPRAQSAPSAVSAPGAVSAPSAPPALGAGSAANVVSAPSAPPAPPAPSAPPPFTQRPGPRRAR